MNLPLSREEFAALVETHAAELSRYAAVILNGDGDTARDVVQDAFVKLWQTPPESRENLRAWLFSVCRSRSIDLLRRRGRMVSDDRLTDAAADGEATSPWARMETDDRHAALLQLVGSLPARQAEIVRLKFQNDLSYAEIAEVTGLTVSNVGFLLHTAMQTLRLRASGESALRR